MILSTTSAKLIPRCPALSDSAPRKILYGTRRP